MIAAGAAAHSDHGRDIAHTLLLTAEGKAGGYEIKDEAKLHALAAEYEIPTEGRTKEEIALDLARAVYAEFGNQEGPIRFTRRAPAARVELWENLGVDPRGVDREIVESMHRTHIGVDNDPVNLILHGLRTSISDGWGGSMIATELSDVLFGTPTPVKSETNLGVLSDDEVNIVVHGHEPTLSEMIVAASQDPEMIELAVQQGAKGINVAGMCCTGNEVLMRHGIPIAGNFLQQELAIITGSVEAMIVDVQCIMPALPDLAGCFHTKIISTSPKAKFPGAPTSSSTKNTPTRSPSVSSARLSRTMATGTRPGSTSPMTKPNAWPASASRPSSAPWAGPSTRCWTPSRAARSRASSVW